MLGRGRLLQRLGYCLAHGGKWGDKQFVPADYVGLCNKLSPHNPHCPYTLMFEQNSDGHVIGAPRDAFWKSGAGGLRFSSCRRSIW